MAEVNIGECQCPGAPHPEGDVVELRDRLGLAAGIAVQKLIIEANTAENRLDTARLTGLMAEGYLLHGVMGWNLVDENGPIPVSEATIRSQLLEDFTRGEKAADAADDLYSLAVLAPLLTRVNKSLPPSRTRGSTSPTGSSAKAKDGSPSTRSSPKPPKRSKPSSTTATRMDGITTISQSLAGVSSS